MLSFHIENAKKLHTHLDDNTVSICIETCCLCFRSRKLNTQLENAIQEAMVELDKQEEYEKNTLKPFKTASVSKKSGRLRSSHSQR